MADASCSPPKTQRVRAHERARPRKRRAKNAPPAGAAKRGYFYVVKDSRTGTIVTRHRDMTAAVRRRRLLDRESARRSQGRPYEVERIAVTVTPRAA